MCTEIKGVFKIYVKDVRVRTAILIYGVKFNDTNMTVYKCNPYETQYV